MDRSINRTRRQIITGTAQRVEGQVITASEALTRRNRQRSRSQEMIDAILRIDTTTDPAMRQEVLDWIRECYVEREGGEIIGLMARCFLGGDFVDHRLDMTLRIAEHFTEATPPPPPFHMCRPLARSTAYAYIELYADGTIVPIRHDGTQAV